MEQIRRVMRPTDVPDTGQHPSVLAFSLLFGPADTLAFDLDRLAV